MNQIETSNQIPQNEYKNATKITSNMILGTDVRVSEIPTVSTKITSGIISVRFTPQDVKQSDISTSD